MNNRVLLSLGILSGFAAIVLGVGFANAGALCHPIDELAVLKNFSGGGEGGWDYVTVDPAGRRVYVARSTRIMVFEADKGTLLGEVADVAGAHGVALVPDRNEGFATSGKDGTVVVFDLKTFKTLRTIKAGQKPDAILYDSASKKVFVFNHGSGDVTVIDPAAQDKEPVTLMVGGVLEFGVSDEAGHVYVNVEDKNEVAVIDSKQLKVTARWTVAPGESPTGLAIDGAGKRLFAGCSNQKLAILDTETGKVLGDMPVGNGVDGIAFDSQLNLAMTSNGKDGTLTAVREGPKGEFTVIQTLKTAKGARTIAADPKTHLVYLPCNIPAGDKTTFGLVVVGAAASCTPASSPATQPAK